MGLFHFRLKGGIELFNHIALFVIAVTIGIVGAIFGLNYWLVISIIVALTLISIGYFLYTMFFSQNLKMIENVLHNNRKDPQYGYLIALKENHIDEAIAQLDLILSKVKISSQVHQYGIIREILANNYSAARKHANEIQQSEVGKYSIALLDSIEGNGEKHLDTIFTKPWMSSSVRAAYYFAKGDREQYEHHRDIALSLTKGIQHAASVYTFRNNETNSLLNKHETTEYQFKIENEAGTKQNAIGFTGKLMAFFDKK